MTKMLPQFTRSVCLDGAMIDALCAGRLVLRPGQWVHTASGRRGQFITARNGVVYVSWVQKGERFRDRTQRFCRANWHQNVKDKVNPVAIVTRAPSSLAFDSLREWFHKLDAKMRAAGVKRIAPQGRDISKDIYADVACAVR